MSAREDSQRRWLRPFEWNGYIRTLSATVWFPPQTNTLRASCSRPQG